ncbi:MAG TPA: TolC family protein [Candidatus Dormibacteraeota bacterium]|nr:TolC family protein [Candidatus Dormibacteraeota bacterium]
MHRWFGDAEWGSLKDVHNALLSVEGRHLPHVLPPLLGEVKALKIVQGITFSNLIGFWLVLILLAEAVGSAQSSVKPPENPLTLDQAVDFALANYPAVRASMERALASKEGVSLSRTTYLPRTDLLWQSNRATRNNIFGLYFPQAVVPPISGPVLSSTSDRGVWGSMAGILLSWEPFDFGYRGANVDVAKATENRANAELSLTKLDVAGAIGDAFLRLAAAQQQVKAAEADVDRRQVLATSVHALVKEELRPGADGSRADAELAAAKIQLIRSQQVERESEATLAELLGIPGSKVAINANSLLAAPATSYASQSALANHPAALVANSTLFETKAREKVLSKSYYPRFNLQGSFSGRGSGANTDGTFGSGTDGLDLMRHNWAVGLTATFSVLDFPSLHFKKQIEQSNERAQRADYDKTIQSLTAQAERAKAAYDSAVLISQNTPVELEAARLGETQANARYQAALAPIVEVAEAQRLLLQAETEDNLARLTVWRAMLGEALAQGDVQPFLELARKRAAGGQ